MIEIVVKRPGVQGAPGLVWRGAWQAGVAYQPSEAVTHNGSSYRAKAAHLADAAAEPGIGATWMQRWDVLARAAEQPYIIGAEVYRLPSIEPGTYIADPWLSGNVRLSDLRGDVFGSAGATVEFYLDVNGAIVAGPLLVTVGAPASIPLDLVLPKGARVSIVVVSASTGASYFFAKAAGLLA